MTATRAPGAVLAAARVWLCNPTLDALRGEVHALMVEALDAPTPEDGARVWFAACGLPNLQPHDVEDMRAARAAAEAHR